MKKYIYLFVFFWGVNQVFAQPDISPLLADSLKQALEQTTNDTSRVLILEQLTRCYTSTDLSMALRYGRQGKSLAEKIGYLEGKLLCTLSLGFVLARTNNHAEGLQILFEANHYAEQHHNYEQQAKALSYITTIYSWNNEHEKALEYARQAKAIQETHRISEAVNPISLPLGVVYRDLGMTDTAIMYFQKAYEIGLQNTLSTYITSSTYYLADIYEKSGYTDLAFDYYRKCIDYSIQLRTNYTISRAYQGLAHLFDKVGQPDSAMYYAKKALSGDNSAYYYLSVVDAATLLAEIYDKKNNPREALNYYKIAAAAKDSLFSREKARQIEKMAYEEKEREIRAQRRFEAHQEKFQNQVKIYTLLGVLFVVLVFIFFLFRNIRQKQKDNTTLEKTLSNLQATQSQLIQAEKLASLGELTAGIAHEIQNPLNFVNNFAEVSAEMLGEMEEELDKGDTQEAKAIAADLKQNLEKITHHGKRASSIVKSMLEHSRTRTGVKESTDLNALADEYLRLAYHGLRAKDSSFNAKIETDFDPDLPLVSVVPQDIGRVFLNLINNALYAVGASLVDARTEGNLVDARTEGTLVDVLNDSDTGVNDSDMGDHKGRPDPTISISSQKENGQVVFKIRDNGPGIPESIRDKIFQPFFTTKPTGQGTGLGLSLAYDIVVKGHGGALEVESIEGKGTVFILKLPLT
ncbi:MAG: ATP-binding protein [Bacteroidia bacterium]|nr:ATP-binding protein [Bacteroidia bacterium]